MNTLLIAFYLVSFFGCLVSGWYAICGLNACTPQTPLVTRISFAAITVGAFAVVLNPPDLDLNGFGTTATFVGLAIGFLANRKTCVCLNCPARGNVRKPAPYRHDDRGAHA